MDLDAQKILFAEGLAQGMTNKEALKFAGYSPKSTSTAARLCKDKDVIEYKSVRIKENTRPAVAQTDECLEILSEIARNVEASNSDRIKAISVLLQCDGKLKNEINIISKNTFQQQVLANITQKWVKK